MLNLFKSKLKRENQKLLLENSKLSVELNNIQEADRILGKIVAEKLDLRDIDLSTSGQVNKISSYAKDLLKNPVLQYILNQKKYTLMQGIIHESRNYPEVVQKRSNLVFVEHSIIDEIKKFAGMKFQENPEEKDDLDFLNNN